MSVMQAIPMQPGMQGMQPMMPPYAMELANAASAAGYWADRLSTDEQQRSHLVMQKVQRSALNGPHFLVSFPSCCWMSCVHTCFST